MKINTVQSIAPQFLARSAEFTPLFTIFNTEIQCMSRLLHLLLFVFTASTSAFAQPTPLKAYIDQKCFFSPETGTYAEIQLQFIGYSLKYASVEGGLQSRVAIRYTVTSSTVPGDTIATDAYVLESPVMRDSVIEDFFDISRFAIGPGKYTVHIALSDLISNAQPMTGQIDLEVPVYTDVVSFSEIMVAEVAVKTNEPTVFSKSGYDIIPRFSNLFPTDFTSLPYYAEIYNTSRLQDSAFAVRQRIVSTTDAKEMQGFTRNTKMKTGEVIPLLRNLDITALPSGSYRLELSLIDRNNNELGGTAYYYFERINELEQVTSVEEIVLDPAFQASITDDSVAFYLSSLIPIARPAEAKSILSTLKSNNKEMGRKHIQQFWLQTSGTNAYSAWMEYKKQVMMVQELYASNFQDGFETDRGRVYLQYGPPNSVIVRENSPSEYPYEIWHYHKIKMYSNKRFVFYNPDLVNNGYRLLHSDMVGEQQNYRWQMALNKRDNQNTNIDDPGTQNSYGQNSNYYYRQY